jgi:hypothetical protein
VGLPIGLQTLQTAYNNGNTIVTVAADGDIAFSGTEAFTAAMGGIVDLQGSTVQLTGATGLTATATTGTALFQSVAGLLSLFGGTGASLNIANNPAGNGGTVAMTSGTSSGGGGNGGDFILTAGAGNGAGSGGDFVFTVGGGAVGGAVVFNGQGPTSTWTTSSFGSVSFNTTGPASFFNINGCEDFNFGGIGATSSFTVGPNVGTFDVVTTFGTEMWRNLVLDGTDPLTWPSADGTAGQQLTTNGAGL